MSIVTQDIHLAPAGSIGSMQTIEVSGQIFDFLASGSSFDVIEVRPNIIQGASQLKQGQGFDAGSMIDRWIVVNNGTTAINGTVVISTGGFRNFRISGTVDVLDGGKNRTLANLSFGTNGGVGPVAAQYGRLQLWNPAASGKRLVIEAMTLWSSASSNLAVCASTAPLANVLGVGAPKLLGGAASAAQILWDTNAVSSGVGITSSYPIVAGQLQTVHLNEPLVVTPGLGVMLVDNLVNNTIQANFEWYEESNT